VKKLRLFLNLFRRLFGDGSRLFRFAGALALLFASSNFLATAAISASSANIEKQLEEYNVSMFITMGMPVSQAKDTVRGLLKLAKEESQKEGTSNLPHNFGDILLEKESTDDNIKSMLAKKRKEGVRNEDIT
jgi:hypothetical protein